MPDTSKKNTSEALHDDAGDQGAQANPTTRRTDSSSNSNSGKSGNGGAKPSQCAFIKEGWGSRKEFQLSYGLKMTPEDFEEGNRILEGFEKQGVFEKKM